MAQSMHPAGMPLKVLLNVEMSFTNVLIRSMKTFLGFEVSYAPCIYTIIATFESWKKWRPLVDSVIVAPLADDFFFNLRNRSLQ